jgi:hypothetical protein
MVPYGSKQIHKTTTIPTVQTAQPFGYKLYNSLGVLQSTGSSPGPETVFSGTADIVYTNRPKGSKSIKSNFCIHRRTQTKYMAENNTFRIIRDLSPGHSGWYYEYYNGHHWSLVNHTLAVAAAKAAYGGISASPYVFANAQGWIDSASDRTKPDLNKFDVFNFSLQIDGVKGLYFAWDKCQSLVKNLANNFLAYKFGVAPDWGDARAVVSELLLFRKHLEQFQQMNGLIYQTTSLCLNEDVTHTGSVSATTYVDAKWNARYTRKATAYIAYRFEPLLALGTWDRDLRAVMSIMGVELNPRILWDAIPFSFVVDWFLNVGKVLSRFKIPALELPVSFADSFIQYKGELSIESVTTLDIGNPNATPPTVWPSSVTLEKYFMRLPILPDPLALSGLGWRVPSKGQAILGLALGATLGLGKKARLVHKDQFFEGFFTPKL